MRPYDAAIFDLDGTLIDTLTLRLRAIAACAPRRGLPPVTREAMMGVISLCNQEMFAGLYPDIPAAERDALEALVMDEEALICQELGEAVFFPGVPAMLRALRAGGVRLFISSAGLERHARDALGCGGVLPLFEHLACDAPDKIALTAGLLSGLDPARTAFIGDSDKDVQAAHGNDLIALGAGFGYARQCPRFDRTFDTPQALSAYLLGQD